MKTIKQFLLPLFLALCLALSGCALPSQSLSFSLEDVPDFDGQPYVLLNDNVPDFPAEYGASSFETYAPLDFLGRCGAAYANVCQEIMPTEDRGEIGQVKPSGWHTVKYDVVDGKYLYNRCHLIGYQLAGENANEQNLITGTRYMNVDGMLPFENQVADYVHETGNHVLYRVTPIFEGTDLVAGGVQMEALSVEDGGEGVRFNVYVYNAQPGVSIDYATGDSWLTGNTPASSQPANSAENAGSGVESAEAAEETYILNTKSMKFHRPECSGAASMSETNRQTYTGSRDALVEQGYAPCGQCKP